ncbi:MAG: hypothetical protein Q4F65_09140 [Propionibacteriaceae bacterium]|nr:hypothetical protein [Propionibacteriaceae bacterium]
MTNSTSPLDRLRLRPGATLDFAPKEPRELHLRRMEAGLPTLGNDSYFFKDSAAVVHGLPLFDAALHKPHVVRLSGGHGEVTSLLHAYRCPDVLPQTEKIGDLRVTTLAQTAADLMRRYTFRPALAVADAALRLGADRHELFALVQGGRGCRIASEAVLRADARSESPYESLCRALMLQHGIPLPELQVDLTDERGFIGRVDFWWRYARLVGEFDGMVKLLDHLGDDSIADALAHRSARDDRLRARGETVLHWVADDIHQVEPFVMSLREHFGDQLVDHGLRPEAMGYRRVRGRTGPRQ